MRPCITSLGYALPSALVLTQDEAIARLGYTSQLVRRLAKNTQIAQRRFALDPIGMSVQELSEGYVKAGVELSLAAVRDCLGERDPQEFGTLVFVSTTQQLMVCPGMAFRIAGELGMFSDAKLVDDVGGGCQGALPGLATAYAYLHAYHRPVLLISCEICSATFYHAVEDDLGVTISNLLFSDAASAAIVEFSDDPQFPAILDFHSYFSPEGLSLLGYEFKDGRQKVVLSREVPRVVPKMVALTVMQLLQRHSLKVEDISQWVMHNGGAALLDNIAPLLSLDSQRDFRYSWDVLHDVGNCSSATVGIIAKRMHGIPENRQGYVMGVAMGAGAAVNVALLRYD